MNKINILLITVTLLPVICGAQTTLKIISLPKYTPKNCGIYIAGNFNNWNPSDSNFLLKPNDDKTYTYVFSEKKGSIEFKFTRGSWQSGEKGANCEEIQNRTCKLETGKEFTYKILNWSDSCNSKANHTATDNVKVLTEQFYMPQLKKHRRIWIYLPPDYAESQKHYPVLYMHDGQNLFDAFYSYAGEWGVDETLNEIYKTEKKGLIVVGIDHGGEDRLKELTPWKNAKYGGGNGDRYARFIVETLKPHIDSTFRTIPNRQNTAIMGSSLGGLESYYISLKYQKVFSKAGVFSPSLWFSDSVYILPKINTKNYKSRIYILAGGQEGEVVEQSNKLKNILLSGGYKNKEIKVVAIPDGKHNEAFWRKEFPAAYKWLFEK